MRHYLQAILDNINEAIIFLDRDGTLALANARVNALLGLSASRITGQSLENLLDEPDFAARFGMDNNSLRLLLDELQAGRWQPNTEKHEYQLSTPPHSIVERTQAAVRDSQGELDGILMIFTDQTESHEVRLAQDEIFNMVVHDLRSPLASVRSGLEVLRGIANPDDPVGKIILQTTGISERAIEKVFNLVSSLLDISQMESGTIVLEREPTDINGLIASALDDLHAIAVQMDMQLRQEALEGLPLVNIDRDKIERVLRNLIDNAIKFTPSGGTISVKAGLPDGELIRSGYLCVEVRDTGPGIPNSYKQSIFDRYQQIEGQKGRRHGIGLGLTFCKLSIEAHGGQIWVEDNPSGGAVFVFTLPTVGAGKP